MAFLRQIQQGATKKQQGVCIIAALCAIYVVVTFVTTTSTNRTIEWGSMIVETLPTCHKTLIHPFRAGCPAKCDRAQDNETMYRMHIEWYLGMPNATPNTAYEYGINFQCNNDFHNNFVEATKEVQDESIAKLPNITVKRQLRMHLSLSYLCCLRKNETDWAREIMREWVLENYPFDFTVKFNKLECWHESYNSITTIIVGDHATQDSLIPMTHAINKKLEARGIAVPIRREDQMPYHITLLQLRYGAGEGIRGQDDIEPDIPVVHEIINRISNRIGQEWAGEGRMRLTHAPYFSIKGNAHTGF